MAGFERPEEFDAWKLAWELKERIIAFTATKPAERDRRFCDEICESARSAPDNISEGFYRFNPPDFANFVRIARGSLGEVRNQLRHAHSSRYLSDDEFHDLSRLCRRAIGACTGLRLYLLSLPKDFDPRSLPKKGVPKPPQNRTATEPRTANCEPERGTGTRNRNPVC
jgi:four helix bundle protein